MCVCVQFAVRCQQLTPSSTESDYRSKKSMGNAPLYWNMLAGCGTLLSETQTSHLLALLCDFAVMEDFSLC